MPKDAKVVVIEVTAKIPAMNQDVSNNFFEGKSGSPFDVKSPRK